jgi:hypothetical protein
VLDKAVRVLVFQTSLFVRNLLMKESVFNWAHYTLLENFPSRITGNSYVKTAFYC